MFNKCGIIMENNKDKTNLHKRHRANMRQVYYNSGLESLPDHTVLELLLYFGIPMKDTNELAHILLERFGSFSAVLQADMADLQSVPGMTENAACLLSMLLPVYRRYSDDLNGKKVVLDTPEAIYEFIRPKYYDSKNERFYAVFLDSSNRVIATRMICEGEISSAVADLRTLVSACLETKARSVILSHNHNSSVSAPSNEDVELTMNISAYLNAIGVTVTDHLIVSSNGYCSMASTPKFASTFNYG